MEKHQMKQLYQDIDVPKAELKNVIHSAAVRAGKEGAVRRRWGRKVINGLAVLCGFVYSVSVLRLIHALR